MWSDRSNADILLSRFRSILFHKHFGNGQGLLEAISINSVILTGSLCLEFIVLGFTDGKSNWNFYIYTR